MILGCGTNSFCYVLGLVSFYWTLVEELWGLDPQLH